MRRSISPCRPRAVALAWAVTLGGLSPAMGQVVQNTTTQYGYDANGNLTGITDPLGQVTTRGYDALNRLIQVLQPSPGTGQPQPTTGYAYDGQDHLIQVTDPRSLVTSYIVDGLGNQTQLSSPDTGTTGNTYDEAGNLKTKTDAKGQKTTYSYDALNRVNQALYHDGSKTVYGYDQGANGIGHLTRISEYDGNGTLTSQLDYGYDPLGRVTDETRTIAGTSIASHYLYANGRLSQVTYPSGRVVDYGYDAMGRINRIDSTRAGQAAPENVLSNVQYQPFGGVTSYTYGNGQVHIRAFDLDGRIDSVSLGAKTYNVGYDFAGQLKSITDANNSAQTTQYDYDPLGRLIGATLPGASHGYGYDAVGNRLARTGSAPATYTYAPASNQLTSVNGVPQPFDANGSLIANANISLLYHDVRGRLILAAAGGVQTAYQVDALGRRIRKTNPGGDTLYHYDLSGHLIAETNPAGVILKEYLYLGDLPVAVVAQ